MATYLQGVQDYIPQFQPFQPDLNLYANVLQTKQTQYDTAWKSLNNVYGQYFYSDLTRDSNKILIKLYKYSSLSMRISIS
jgi:hypothetical protein